MLANAKELTPGEAIGIVLSLAWETALFLLAVVGLFCAAVVVVEGFLWFKHPAPDAGARGGKLKTLARSPFFWITSCCTLLVALGVNAMTYYRSYGNCCVVAGWPLHFWICGGIVGIVHFDTTALVVDAFAAITLATATGIGFRNGPRPLFRRARAWLRKARPWPHEDMK